MTTLTSPPPRVAPSVFIVDDDASICRSLARVMRAAGLEAQTFSSAEDFLQARPVPVLHPACLVLDLQMPGMDGLELQRRLIQEPAPCPVVFMSGNGEISDSVQAMKQGAITFLAKPFDPAELLKVIEEALAKHAAQLAANSRVTEVRTRLETLSIREREVMGWVITGALNKQIADTLGITVQTVKVHRGRAMDKMRTASVAELVHLCAVAGVKSATGAEDPRGPKV